MPVNEALAAAALEELDREPDAAVLFHDYHLYLAPRLVREARPEVVTSHFVHIPWPEPDYWHALPPRAAGRRARGPARERRRRLPHRALAARVPRSRSSGCSARGWIGRPGRSSTAAARPGGRAPDQRRPGGVRPAAPTIPAVLEREAALVARRPEQLVLRVDRDRSVEEHRARLSRRSGCCSSGIPSCTAGSAWSRCSRPRGRTSRSTRSTSARVEAAAREVNERFGRDDWQPVELDVADDFPRSVAGYKQFDVLLVNPVFDGLNLVAKEAFLVNAAGRRARPVRERRRARGARRVGDHREPVRRLRPGRGALRGADARAGRAPPPGRGDPRARPRRTTSSEWIDAQLADLDAVRSS